MINTYESICKAQNTMCSQQRAKWKMITVHMQDYNQVKNKESPE